MKYQNQLSGKNKKTIINLSSAELAHIMVKVEFSFKQTGIFTKHTHNK